MRVEDLLVFGKSYCHKDHVKLLLADFLNLNPLELLNHLAEEIEEEKVKQFYLYVQTFERFFVFLLIKK